MGASVILWCERDNAWLHGWCWGHPAGTTTIAAPAAAPAPRSTDNGRRLLRWGGRRRLWRIERLGVRYLW